MEQHINQHINQSINQSIKAGDRGHTQAHLCVEQAAQPVVGKEREHKGDAEVGSGQGRHKRLGVLLGQVAVKVVQRGRVQHIVLGDASAGQGVKRITEGRG